MRDLCFKLVDSSPQALRRKVAGGHCRDFGRCAGRYVRFAQGVSSAVAASTDCSNGAPGVKTISRNSLQHTFLAVGSVLLAGLAATFLLWPRQSLPPVAPVDQYDFFSSRFIERAEAFGGPQSWLNLTSLLLFAAVPVAIALWWPCRRAAAGDAWWTGRRSRFGGAPAGAAVAAGVGLAATIAALPVEFAAFTRSRGYGLAVQSAGGWIADRLLGALLLSGFAALLGAVTLVLLRRLPRAWPAALAAVTVMLALFLQLISPLVLEPLFADFKPLPAGTARDDVERIAARAGVDAGEIHVVDAARRTTAANAYVSGLGATKRVVLYDTLLSEFNRAERRNVIAHELGHARYGDLWRGLLWFALAAGGSAYGVATLARLLARRRGVSMQSPAAVAMIAAAAVMAVALSQPAAGAYSRRVEARADAFALSITGEPRAAIALERRITRKNLARPAPPWFPSRLLGSHPAPVDRIGMAVTVQRRSR